MIDTSTDTLDNLAAAVGIEPSYTDYWGREHLTSVRTKRALLETMGLRVETPEAAEETLRALEERSWRRALDPVAVLSVDAPLRVHVVHPAFRGDEIAWTLTLEDGSSRRGAANIADLPMLAQRMIDGRLLARYSLELPLTLPIGYHRLEIDDAALTLIVTPVRCYLPPALDRGGRVWGIAAQLYSLRSRRNWGVGDFSDLAALARVAHQHGVSFIALNPLHELDPSNPSGASPYSPSSRLYVDVMYLDVEAIADYAECFEAQAFMQIPEVRRALADARAAELIDYETVWTCKRNVLEMLYFSFRTKHLEAGTKRGQAFGAFVEAGGAALEGLSRYEALREHFARKGVAGYGWSSWPQAYQNPSSPDVQRFAETHKERIAFFSYLQWQCDAQLGAAAAAAHDMEIGLYRDLAVGAQDNGADTWMQRDVLLPSVSVGAPPDLLNVHGQRWGVAPFDPTELRERAYAPFIDLLRANMRYAGALRIDHVMSLMRLFWVPPEASATEGAYVSYPFADLVGILALESHRNKCLVVGEDLGTVPPGFRERMRWARILSCRVLLFERKEDGSYRRPGEYPPLSATSPGTHDLATLSAFWLGADITLRASLHLLPSDVSPEEVQRERTRERALLIAALRESGDLNDELAERLRDGHAPDAEDVHELVVCTYRFLARTPSRLLVAQLEDILGITEQINVPGTFFEHPNWRRKLTVDIEDLANDERVAIFASALREVRSLPPPPMIPGASYRLQFNEAFTFADAEALVPYLAELGISHVYASPLFAARPHSTHGYDIVDHNRLNPELGTREDFDRFIATLHRYEMGLILDIVPNHIGIGGAENPWWLDVLEWGENSPFASWFDINWHSVDGELRGKVLAPLLGDRLGEVLLRRELQLKFDQQRGSFDLWYHQHRFPLALRSYPLVLDTIAKHLGKGQAGASKLSEMRADIAASCSATRSPSQQAALRAWAESLRMQLVDLARDPEIAEAMTGALERISADEGEPPLLQRLLRLQHYRLSSWRVAADEINYRRFFDINDLAGIRVEVAECFAQTHRLLFDLIENGSVQGVRIDHIDGLFDPRGYCALLRAHGEAMDYPLYLLVEKILARHENLRSTWPVQGTTGYDLCNILNGLFVDASAEERFDRLYRSFTRARDDFDTVTYDCKLSVMDGPLASELHVLAVELDRIARSDIASSDYTLGALQAALQEIIAAFPVYRTYVDGDGASPEDRRDIEWALTLARRRSNSPDDSIFSFIASILTTDAVQTENPRYPRRTVIRYAMKFQQYTAPVMAKAMEDTAFYRSVRLLSLNEVGGDPRRFGISVAAFHQMMRERIKRWPYSLSSTSTHDTKRSEDVRTRISVLTELPIRWRRALLRFERFNRRHKREVEGNPAPDRLDEYALYQTLLGSWPIELDAETLGSPAATAYGERIETYLIKAMREAKRRSSWSNPNKEYEDAVIGFFRGLLNEPGTSPFWNEFFALLEPVARIGMLNALSQTLLKFTVPGVPDTYQGTESWDLSLVDPDNRRPVDFQRFQSMAASLPPFAHPDYAHTLLETWKDGRVKFFVTKTALRLRQARREAYLRGGYTALDVTERAQHVIAFEHGECITLAPRLVAPLLGEHSAFPIGERVWGDCALVIPPRLQGRRYVNAFTGESFALDEHVKLAILLGVFPLALLVPEEE